MAAPRPGLFGRDPEVAVLSECLAAAADGQGRTVLCVGEAGIGKTRLAEEADASARALHFAVAWGIADDAAGTPPFWMWRQIFRSLADSSGLATVVGELGLTRELAPLLPSGATMPEGGSASADSAEARFRLFDAASTALRATSQDTPLALVLDDAHWADEASLLLLRHLVRSVGDDRLLVWVNTRQAGGEGGRTFLDWGRLPSVRRLSLVGLDQAAVRRQLQSLVGADINDAEVAGVQSLTAGNPFFVTEAARTLADRRLGRRTRRTSSGTREAVVARVAQLPPACQLSLRAAAVVGREFDVGLVASVLDTSEIDCVAALGPAQDAALLEPAGTSRPTYRFVHAIVRDAIEDTLGASERIDLHRRAAAAIEQAGLDPSSPQVFEIARHWAEAAPGGGRDTAATWVERAADLAFAQLAYEDASRLYAEALAIGGDVLDAKVRSRLLLSGARAANRSGALGEAHALRTQAVAVAPADAELDVMAEAAFAMDSIRTPGFELATRRLCEAVLERIDASATPHRARVTARYAETFVYLPDDRAADEASALALRVAGEAGDREALVASLRARQVVVSHPSRLDERADVAERMLAISLQHHDFDLELRGRLCLVDVLFERGDLSLVTTQLDAAEACANELHSALGRFLVHNTRAVLAQAQGRLREARRLSDEAIAAGGWGDHPDPTHRRTAVISGIARHAGLDDETLAALAPPDAGSKPPFIADVAAANALVLAGELNAATDLWHAVGPPQRWHPPAHVVLLGPALGMETALALGRTDDVAAIATQLEPYRGHHVVCGYGAASYLGPVELWLGKAAAHLGQVDEAVTDLEAAADACRAVGAACYEVEARYELASTLTMRGHPGDTDSARAIAKDCSRAVEDLGMSAFRERIELLQKRLVGGDADPLTKRERQVAALVANGLSNREIANSLFMSERTAENHVQHIFLKLGLRNRAELVRWYTRGPEMSTESE